ncbi:MAG TPA: hypothetical protein VK574_02380 [Terracidiphilus sp.]|nr:hypothetical protein [Terracidiphilus sp.]
MSRHCLILNGKDIRNFGLISLACSIGFAAFLAPLAQAQTQNPIQAMKDAWKKTREQQQQVKQPQSKKVANPGSGSNSAAPTPKNLPHSSAHVDDQLMAASETGLQFQISETSAHFVAPAHRGSRMVMLFDGAEGPKFDQIVPMGGASGPVVFSPDGTRFAYTGRSGPEKVVMVDGKEVLRFDESKTALAPGAFNAADVEFTPNSKHFFFRVHPISTMGHESDAAHFYWDGVPGPPFADYAVISPDGDHYAYFTHVPSPNGDAVPHLYLDGKAAGYMGGNPQFTADGKHLFTEMNYPRPTPYTEVLLDGKPIMKATAVQLYMPPTGYNFVAVLGTGIGDNYRFLAVGNKKVEGSECRGSGGYDQVSFTPDGKHWAARCESRSGYHFVIADGKRGSEYGDISMLNFTADGTVTYFAGQLNKHYVVIGDQESEGYDGVGPAAAQDLSQVGMPGPSVIGEHLAYVSRTSGTRGAVMHIDGKAFPATDLGKLQFSPDGKHFAFVTTGNDPRYGTVVLDGVNQPGTYMDMSQIVRKNRGYIPTIVFSPDSKHVAWYGTSPSDPESSGIFVDGKFVRSGEAGLTPYHVTFTPDSKHLVYGSIMRTEPSSFGVFVDGRLAAQLDLNNSLMQNESSWQWADDGSLFVFGQDADGLKRLRIKPADDTSVATMVGSGATIAENR